MEKNNVSNTDRLKASLCYIPLGGAVLYFIEQKKSEYLTKHIKYGTFLFVGYIIVRMIFWGLFLPIGGLLLISYLGLAIYFGMKAYNGENFNIEAIDSMYKNNNNGSQNFNNTSTNSQTTKKVDEFDENGNTIETTIKTNNIVIDKIANGFSNVVKNVKSDKKDEFADDENIKQEDNKKNDDVLDF